MIKKILSATLRQFSAGTTLLVISISAVPAEELKNTFETEDMQLITETNINFTSCIQQASMEIMDSHGDVREIAGLSVEKCAPVLKELDDKLAARNINPDFYKGMIQQMKGRSIRRLLPLLMMEKSNRSVQ